MDLQPHYHGKTVLVTGHTGFKGSWLCEWLLLLGARVVGIGLPPNTHPALFDQLSLADRVEHHILDIREREALAQRVLATKPDYIFHLAAQPLVRLSYAEPVETYATNVMGTVHLLDALRDLQEYYKTTNRTCATVFVTTDKCYENREWVYGYREEDAMGGYDPYSSSKAGAELAISAYRRSFFNTHDLRNNPCVGIASARAGNVIGGGDWAMDRIVPDCIRHLEANNTIPVRNPYATRPWQHVLEPLSGYLTLALQQNQALLTANADAIKQINSSFNFGPELSSNKTVQILVEHILKLWPGQWSCDSSSVAPHEAGLLNLSWEKAFHSLSWHPRWDFEKTVKRTVDWYRQALIPSTNIKKLIQSDILAYTGYNQGK